MDEEEGQRTGGEDPHGGRDEEEGRRIRAGEICAGEGEEEGRRARCHIAPHIWKETGPRRCWPELGARRPVTKGDCIKPG